jgi:LacI family transcriptional regulator
MPTILQVANQAGVSPTTVSHVINKTRFVSAEVTERVQAAMNELGYQPNALARSLRRGQTLTLGLILPDSANPYFAEVGREIESLTFQNGYSLILCNAEDNGHKESIYTDVLSKKQVDGMIFVATGTESDSVRTLLKQRLPLVLVDRQLDGIEADTVLTDNYCGGILAAKHLAGAGHARFGCITGPSYLTPSAERVTGFLETLTGFGIPTQHITLQSGNFHPDSGYQAGFQLMRAEQRPTAIFCCNDMMAIGLYRAIAELGLRIPDDVAVIGFDDIDLSQYLTPPLTTIKQPKHQIGEAAVGMLLERIKDRNLPARRVMLKTQLVVRKSTGTLPSQIRELE